MGKILITGATGTVGRKLVTALVRAGERMLAASRRPEQPESEGVEPVTLDFEQPQTFESALVDVDRVFLIARPGDEAADRVALPLIEAMERCGVSHVVNLSALGSDVAGHVPALRNIEQRLERSRMTHTHLRPNFFAQFFAVPPLSSVLKTANVLELPAANATIAFVDAGDVAEVARAALIDPVHRGRAYTLTGPRALDHAEVAAAIAHATGRALAYRAVDEFAFALTLRGFGLPPDRVERTLRFYRRVREGAASLVTDDVARILGRPARTFQQVAWLERQCWL
ncbi:MAG: azoB 1 [Myxococcaceae bacterium]|nr:azoB 1 [Myxococcaceae bacterium]